VLTYLHGDALGSASLATSVTGTVVSSMRYYPYGGTRSGSIATDRRYTGQRWEGSVGFYDYGARSYDPALGRFLQADSIVSNLANPQSFNRYSYVLNNPLKYTDPTGHMEIYGGDTYPVSDYWYTYLNPALPECQSSSEEVIMMVRHGSSTMVDFITGVGDVKGFIEVFTGKDLITGEELGWTRYFGLVALSEARHFVRVDPSLLRSLAPGSDEAASLIDALATQYTRVGAGGSSSRVVLGKWGPEGSDYIAEAGRHGGIFYKTDDDFFEAIGKSDDLAWAVNERFLRNQLESGVDVIELYNTTVADVLHSSSSFLQREINFLLKYAGDYGYELMDDFKWVKSKP
jgi:RHS repeat-associated protein